MHQYVRTRVLRRGRLLPVRAGPVREPRGRDDERLQTLLRRRISTELELEAIERLRDLLDLDLGGLGLRLLALAQVVAADDAQHDADQRQDDENLDQRHAVLTATVHR